MYRGENIFQGAAGEAVVAYSDAVREAARKAEVEAPAEGGLSQGVMTFNAEIERVSLLSASGQSVTVLESGATATLAIDVYFKKNVSQPIFAFFIRTPDGYLIYNTTTRWMNIQTPNFSAGERCRVEFYLKLPLLEGEYQLGVDIAASDLSHFYDRLERALEFGVKGSNGAQGLVDLEAKIAFG